MPSEGVVSSWSAEPTPDGAGGGFLCLPAGAQGQCQQKAGQGGGKAKAVEFHGIAPFIEWFLCGWGHGGRRWLGAYSARPQSRASTWGGSAWHHPSDIGHGDNVPYLEPLVPHLLCSEMDRRWASWAISSVARGSITAVPSPMRSITPQNSFLQQAAFTGVHRGRFPPA